MKLQLTAALVAGLICTSGAMGQALMGEIKITARQYCGAGWVETNGQTYQVATNTGLFSLLGTVYGGDGAIEFDLPDLRGRSPVGEESLDFFRGEAGGQEEITLNQAHLPAHTHALYATSAAGTKPTPGGNELAEFSFSSTPIPAYHNGAPGTETLSNQVLDPAGFLSTADFNVRQPSLGVRFCISVTGQFPERPGRGE